MVEIKMYHPIYKQAILDLTEKAGFPVEPVALNFKVKNFKCFVAIKKGKFVGYIIGAPDPRQEDTFFVHSWVVKPGLPDREEIGIKLAFFGKQEIQLAGQYKYLEFYRSIDNTYHREEIR